MEMWGDDRIDPAHARPARKDWTAMGPRPEEEYYPTESEDSFFACCFGGRFGAGDRDYARRKQLAARMRDQIEEYDAEVEGRAN